MLSSDESDSPSSTPSDNQQPPPPSPPLPSNGSSLKSPLPPSNESPPSPSNGSSSKSPPPSPSNESPRSPNKSLPLPPATPDSSSPSISTPTSSPPKSPILHVKDKLLLPYHQRDNSFSKRAGLGAAIGLGLIFIIWVIICIVRLKRKKKEKTYYGDEKGKDYHSSKYASSYYQSHKGSYVVRTKDKGSCDARPNPLSRATVKSESSNNLSSMASPPHPPPPPIPTPTPTPQGTFSYEELKSATDGFDEKNLLGQGGFGYVHKGVLSNGKEIAVKSLKANSGQGEIEFQTEVGIISRVHHRHLVSLVGYCIAGRRRLLVYEFVPNKTLEYHLHDKTRPTMDWSTRLRIAIGSGKGLAYLHEDCNPRIIHRDIKASNILLDEYFEPKVADFGLAKLTNDNSTHVSTRVMGTFGYLAPEYASSGRLTEKSDVYSFGVMLLELITGKKPTGDIMSAHEDGLVDWARPLLNSILHDGNFRDLVDPFLEGNYNAEEMKRMAHCASASLRHSSKRRPRMGQIVRVLEGVLSLENLSYN